MSRLLFPLGLCFGLIVASPALAESPQDPATLHVRVGAGADLGKAGIGPSASVEALVVKNGWVGGVRADGVLRRLVLSSADELSGQLEVGRQVPIGRVRLQITATGGMTWSRFTEVGMCAPLDPDGPCREPVEETRLRPEVGGSLGVTNARGNLWVGLRGRAITPSIGLGFTLGF